MTNHMHFVVRAGDEGLTPAMRDLFGRYTRYANRRRAKKGHLFQNRCHVERIATDAHLLVSLAYVDLNPVRAGVVERPEDWRWSSYRAHVGLEHPSALLANDEFLRLFGGTPELAMEAYRKYVLSWQERDLERRTLAKYAALEAVSDTRGNRESSPTAGPVSDTKNQRTSNRV